MPLYDLYCSCNYRTERLLKINSAMPECPKCGKNLKKAISKSTFVLKGGGWSSEGYSRKS